MTTKVQKWGNSLAIRLPKKIADRLGLKEGVEVAVAEEEKTAIVVKKIPVQVKKLHKRDWRLFIVPSGSKKKERVSEKIDEILYGQSPR